MDVSYVAPANLGDAVVVPVFDGRSLRGAGADIDAQTGGALTRALGASRVTGKPGESLEVMGPAGLDAGRVVLIGLGDGEVGASALERAVAGAVRTLLTSGAEHATVRLDGLALSADLTARAGLAAGMAAYRFDTYRTKLAAEKRPSLIKVSIAVDDAEAAAAAHVPHGQVEAGVRLARDLVNAPPNVLHPESFADRCVGLVEHGLEVEVLNEAAMADLGMHMLLGVGLGSVRESRLVIMRWNGGGEADPIAFVGKGVTFDTGGISLKPGPGMEDMKGDMGGAAAVTGVMRALAGRKAKANVVGVIGLVENMPDGKAQRPGDIVTSMSGQTVEILNTDAEGRLVLGDALWYTQERFKPRAIVDLATLTGAMLIALGQEHAGLFSNNDDLASDLLEAGLAVDEPLWRMPMGKAYDKLIDTPNADMKNIGGPHAGSITAAQFLARFVNDTPWAHLDIAPTAWKSKTDDPRVPVWGTGYGVRVLNELVARRFER